MRLTVILFLLVMMFILGTFFGLMYQAIDEEETAHVSDIEHVAEPLESEEPLYVSTESIVLPEQKTTHPLEKVASMLERITTFLFEKIIYLLFAITELFLN